MYIQKVLCDISCAFADNATSTSVAPDAMFNLTKDFSYIVPDNIVRVITNDHDLARIGQKEE